MNWCTNLYSFKQLLQICSCYYQIIQLEFEQREFSGSQISVFPPTNMAMPITVYGITRMPVVGLLNFSFFVFSLSLEYFPLEANGKQYILH